MKRGTRHEDARAVVVSDLPLNVRCAARLLEVKGELALDLAAGIAHVEVLAAEGFPAMFELEQAVATELQGRGQPAEAIVWLRRAIAHEKPLQEDERPSPARIRLYNLLVDCLCEAKDALGARRALQELEAFSTVVHLFPQRARVFLLERRPADALVEIGNGLRRSDREFDLELLSLGSRPTAR